MILSQPAGYAQRNIVKSKYIIVERNGMEAAVVFTRLLLHHEVAGARNVKSAGYCQLDVNGNWIVGGRSESLCLGTRPQDVELLSEIISPMK